MFGICSILFTFAQLVLLSIALAPAGPKSFKDGVGVSRLVALNLKVFMRFRGALFPTTFVLLTVSSYFSCYLIYEEQGGWNRFVPPNGVQFLHNASAGYNHSSLSSRNATRGSTFELDMVDEALSSSAEYYASAWMEKHSAASPLPADSANFGRISPADLAAASANVGYFSPEKTEEHGETKERSE